MWAGMPQLTCSQDVVRPLPLVNIGNIALTAQMPLLAFQLLAGKLYTHFNIRRILLGAIFIFEVGSLVCGVAPTSNVLIAGRAIAGLGSAGIFTGALVSIAHVSEIEKRPLYFSLIGGVYGLASVIGPLVSSSLRFQLQGNTTLI